MKTFALLLNHFNSIGMLRGKYLAILLLVVIGFISCESKIEPDKNDIYVIPDEQFSEEIDNMINSVSFIFDKCENAEELSEYIPAIKEIKYVEKAYISENTLIVKVSGGGKIIWDFPRPEIISETLPDLSDYIMPESKNTDLEDHIYSNKNNLAIIIVERIANYTRSLDVLAKEFQKRNFNVTHIYEKDADIDFFSNEILSYDNVVLETHGGYDEETGLHWMLTGESADYSTFYLNYMEQWQDESIYLGEDGRLCISENFVRQYMKASPKKETLFFNDACLSMAGNASFADELLEKGVQTYLGYDISNYFGDIAAAYFYLNMLNGYNVKEAREKLSEVNYTGIAADTDQEIVFSQEQTHLRLAGATKDCFIHPVIEEVSADVTLNSVELNLIISDAIPNMKVGFCYSAQTKDPTVNNSDFIEDIIEARDINNNMEASLSVVVPDLLMATEYYYRPYVVFDGEYYYGECSTFITSYDEIFAFLLDIYMSTEGWDWYNSKNWLTEKPYDQWYGVSINNYGQLELDLSDNNLKGRLDLKGFNRIAALCCGDNHLTSLDASGCSKLEELYCNDNEISSLTFMGCSSLEDLDCSGNQLSSSNFTILSSLKYLDCTGNPIYSLSLSGMANLEELYCYSYEMKILDISGCSSLTWLDCYHRANNYSEIELEDVDISGCTMLEDFDYVAKSLKRFNAQNCTSLKTLYLDKAKLEKINVLGCSALEYLGFDGIGLELNIDDCVNLKSLYPGGVQSLNINNHRTLEYVYISGDNTSRITLNNCSSLEEVECWSCGTLQISNCNSLAKLDLNPYYGHVDELVVESCNSLTQIYCTDINLSSLTVKSCPEIWEIDCGKNQISDFDISDLPNLLTLDCSNNQISSLNLCGYYSLCSVDCSYNNISAFDIDYLPELYKLYCQENRIKKQIPDWFYQLLDFRYDRRFEYIGDGVTVDNGVGWWYPYELEAFLNPSEK